MKHQITRSHLYKLASNEPLSIRRSRAIKEAKNADCYPFCRHVLRADDVLEVYRGTQATKQGYWKLTIYPQSTKGFHSETYEIVEQ